MSPRKQNSINNDNAELLIVSCFFTDSCCALFL